MANNPPKKTATLSKKHLDRLHRERQQTKWITIGAIVVILLVIGSIGYGVLDQQVLQGLRPVAVVNGEKISVNDFRAFTKYYRSQLIQNAQQTYQIASMFGSDPNSLQSFSQQLVTINGELEVNRAGQGAIDQLVADKLIRQEAQKRGITVSADEVEKAMQEAFRYFANGTPTPSPTVADAAHFHLVAAADDHGPANGNQHADPGGDCYCDRLCGSGADPDCHAGSHIDAHPGSHRGGDYGYRHPATDRDPVYTRRLQEPVYATMMADFAATEIPETTVRYVIESSLYRDKLKAAVIGEITCTQEEVWAQHILVKDEQTANDLLTKLRAGEDWAKLASNFSTDTSNKDKGGDLGWFARGQMVKEFEDAAFALTTPGQISQPVKTQFGYHLIRLVGHENRPITAPTECTRLSDQKFNEWLTTYKTTAAITVNDTLWMSQVPLNPTLPADLQSVIQQIQGANAPPSGYPAPTTP